LAFTLCFIFFLLQKVRPLLFEFYTDPLIHECISNIEEVFENELGIRLIYVEY